MSVYRELEHLIYKTEVNLKKFKDLKTTTWTTCNLTVYQSIALMSKQRVAATANNKAYTGGEVFNYKVGNPEQVHGPQIKYGRNLPDWILQRKEKWMPRVPSVFQWRETTVCHEVEGCCRDVAMYHGVRLPLVVMRSNIIQPFMGQ
ncbi:hypothetical protein CBL_00681 [Carabus blaptoides fortunei]